MKTIGVIGGMGWESTVPYYRQVNETVKHHLGGLHPARVALVALDTPAIRARGAAEFAPGVPISPPPEKT